jgi:hypothetical protein
MRVLTSLLIATAATGCGAVATNTSHGVTRGELGGNVAVVFTNASPEKMCDLHMNVEGSDKFGDNWLAQGGLDVGKSAEFKIKPGKYKATWSTCRQGADGAWFAGTLTQETGFEVKEATQLFAFVADTVAPTKRAAPRDFHKMVKFPGQQIGGPVVAVAPAPPVPTTEPISKADAKKGPAKVAETKTSMGDFIDYKSAYKNTKGKQLKPKASVKRAHDVSTAKVGYVDKK